MPSSSDSTNNRLCLAAILTVVTVLCSTAVQEFQHGWWKFRKENNESGVHSHSIRMSSNNTSLHLRERKNPPRPNHQFPNGGSSNNKPRLILHVGPSKSATTTLQTDLTAVQAALEADDYSYAGRYYNPFVNNATGEFHLGRSESGLLVAAHTMLKHCNKPSRSDCCRTFARQLDHYSPQKNIILSEEPFGNMWRHPQDWQAIRSAVSRHWDVTVVVGYRRFFQWLPSARYQSERVDRHTDRTRPWPQHGGRQIRPFFPNWMQVWRRNYQYTSDILNAINGIFPVRVINLHNPERHSPLRVLLCDVLQGATETACQQAVERESNDDETVMNTQSTAPSLYYDEIACVAARQGLVNITAWSRKEVREAIQHRQEVELGLHAKELDYLDCPSQAKLDALLNVSLELEEKYMPDFAKDERQRDQHREGFTKYVERRVYCWIDAKALLSHDDGWKEFFKQFST